MPEPYYADEHVQLFHGDCREITQWLSADVLVTDPPYGMRLLHESRFKTCAGCGRPSRSRHGTCRRCRDGMPSSAAAVAVVGDDSTAARDAALDLWGADRPALVFGTWKTRRPAATRHVFVWDKGSFVPPGELTIPWASSHEEIYVLGKWPRGLRRGHGVVRVQALVPGQRERDEAGHATPKPIALMGELIRKCPPGTVADPFAGSGSTLLAARFEGRRAIGVEIEEQYCEIAAKRLAQGVLEVPA